MSLTPKGWKPLASECRLNTTATESSWFLRLESLDGTRSMLFNPQGAADIIGAEMDRRAERIKGADKVTTGKDYGLPEEYAEWVEKTHFTAHEFEPMVRIVTEKCTALYPDGSGNWEPLDVHTFIPPKSKPTLPDVGLGGVIAYTDKSGRKCRATQFAAGKWRVYTYAGEIVVGAPGEYWHDSDLLNHADDGFTVELDGLE